MQNHVISEKEESQNFALRRNSLHAGGLFCQDFEKDA